MSEDIRDLTSLDDLAHERKLRERKAAPPAVKPDLKRSIVNDAPEVLDDVYAYLGGIKGSMLYWQNHEDDFRKEIEAKILVKKVTRDVDNQDAMEAGKNIFLTFIQNNGLAGKPKADNSVEEATIVDDKNNE